MPEKAPVFGFLAARRAALAACWDGPFAGGAHFVTMGMFNGKVRQAAGQRDFGDSPHNAPTRGRCSRFGAEVHLPALFIICDHLCHLRLIPNPLTADGAEDADTNHLVQPYDIQACFGHGDAGWKPALLGF